jgi:hypothetical protein
MSIMSIGSIQHISIFTLILIVGCGRSTQLSQKQIESMTGGPMKNVVPVSGAVKVNGSSQSDITIRLHPVIGNVSIAQVRTDSKGKYCWSTYKKGDGLAPGEYKLTFKHQPSINKSGEGKDLFKGRYADPVKSEFKLTVQKGKPQPNLDFDLASK